MPMRVRKAVFPAAGLGTRFLPATKAQPKEMLPLVDKPIIQYGVEEALAAGCDQIIIVTGRGKSAIEDHFDVSYELEKMLEERGKTDLLQIVRQISDLIHIAYVRQKEALGLGHAVLTARELVGNEPFAVLLADDVIDAEVPCLKQMMNVFEKVQCSVLATQVVEGPGISAYGVLDAKPVPGSNGVYSRFRTWWKSPARRMHHPISPSSAATFLLRRFLRLFQISRPEPGANCNSPMACGRCCRKKKCTATFSKASATTPATSWAS